MQVFKSYVTCDICSMRTTPREVDPRKHATEEEAWREVHKQAQEDADALAWLTVPAVHEEHRKRSQKHLCPNCAADIVAALASAMPLPSNDCKAG